MKTSRARKLPSMRQLTVLIFAVGAGIWFRSALAERDRGAVEVVACVIMGIFMSMVAASRLMRLAAPKDDDDGE